MIRCTSATGIRGSRREEYDRFLDAFVQAVSKLFPQAMLHWEDIGLSNARRLLDRYRDQLLTFNDDIQGTGAVNLAAVLAAVRATGTSLAEHRVVIYGAGTAGTGIADQLRAQMLADGLTEERGTGQVLGAGPGGPDHLRHERAHRPPAPARQRPRRGRPAGSATSEIGGIDLAEVVSRVHPTILIGTSTRSRAFTEDIVREMAAHVRRPVILPMSNPTELSEADPADLIRWTDGRALVATGSPFGPGGLRGHPLRHRSGQQRARVPRHRPRRHRVARLAGDRRDAGGRRPRGGRA